MSDAIGHECGVALLRLKKPLEYYMDAHRSPLYGLKKLLLLMQKQRNRGQDGAGMACVKLKVPAGKPYRACEHHTGENSIEQLAAMLMREYGELEHSGVLVPEFPGSLKEHWSFGGEVLLGHLRYGTFGGYGKELCQPYLRTSCWPECTLMVAGNFNLTNVEALRAKIIERGAHPVLASDTQVMAEELGYRLDMARKSNTSAVAVVEILQQTLKLWDGGWGLVGALGNGQCFALRDPAGIRSLHYFEDEEVVAVASERVALMTVFDKCRTDIKEIEPGCCISIDAAGKLTSARVQAASKKVKPCSFERIYFSRGNDPDIYRERKALGAALVQPILKRLGSRASQSVFGFIPNTAEIAYCGLMEELHRCQKLELKNELQAALKSGKLNAKSLNAILDKPWARGEKIAHKDVKLRTFISQQEGRDQMVSSVYDITYDQLGPEDALVCVDDSIVRGTTLRQSILRILARLKPKEIVIASTAPQIRYPDCYGIDMSDLGGFIAFQAMIAELEARGAEELIQETYRACLAELKQPNQGKHNRVHELYAEVSEEQITARIAKLVRPKIDYEGEITVIFQDIKDLHAACPKHQGDWYFTGEYPSAGGYQVVHQAFVNHYEKRQGRSY